MSLLVFFNGSGATPTPQIGNPIGLLLALTYSEGGSEPEPPVVVTTDTGYMYVPRKETVDRVFRALFGQRKKRRRISAKKAEKLAIELLQEFDPGPDLPPIDTSALTAAIRALDLPVTIKDEPKVRSKVLQELFEAVEIIRQDDEDLEDAILLLQLGL